MEVQLLDKELLEGLHEKAAASERLRQNFDLRTTPEDGSQRMLNVLEVGTKVPIHRHLKTSESVICLEGCLDWVFYEEMDDGRSMRAEVRSLKEDGLKKMEGSSRRRHGSGCVLVRRYMEYRCLWAFGTR